MEMEICARVARNLQTSVRNGQCRALDVSRSTPKTVVKESARVQRMQSMMEKIQGIGDTLALPKSIVEFALDVYAAAEKNGVSMRGPEKESIPAAVVFIACRQSGNARSLKEMERATGVAKKQIGKSFLMLTKRLKVETTQASTQDYVHRFCSRLGLPPRTKMIANDVAKKADSLGLSTGKSPVAVAASVVYLVAAFTDAKRSLQEVSDVSMIGEKNVKVVCKELNKSRVMLFDGVLLT